ncbi:MAG: hypothetical protein AAGA54_05360 [Myxococcota bacterium]
MFDINAFWASNVVACTCGADAPQNCFGNAIAYINQPVAVGYTWHDLSILDQLAVTSGSNLAPAWLLAHEFGHNIQNAYGTHPAGQTLSSELGADCLSGYFLGGVACTGTTNPQELSVVLQTVCSLAGNNLWFNPTYGNCTTRVNAVMAGMNGYFSGVSPLERCSFY